MRTLLAVALLCFLQLAQTGRAADGSLPFETLPGDDLRWYDARDLGVVGRGWTDVKEFYDRLPAKAEGVVREPVWNLSRSSSGMYVDFTADTKLIAVRWELRSPTLAQPHMAATGVSGVDLYGRTNDGTWRMDCRRQTDGGRYQSDARLHAAGRKTRVSRVSSAL
ncbi:MAG: SGNH/GDSL hydrolase N-terminal domain-containing protein [Pirellulales bacterium]